MSLFYGVRLSFSDFLVHLLENDADFQEAVLVWLRDPKADADMRENFGQYTLADVLGDVRGEPTGKAKDMQCADFLEDADIERVRTLFSERQQKRIERQKARRLEPEPTPKLLPLTLFEELEIEHDCREGRTADQEEDGLVYIGQRLEVYSGVQRQELPLSLTALHERLLAEFPQKKPGFIEGY